MGVLSGARWSRRAVTALAVVMVAAGGSAVVAPSAGAATTTVRVDADTPVSAPGVPPVATGVQVSADRPVTITATGTATCTPLRELATSIGCQDADANGSSRTADASWVGPGLRGHSLVARIGDGPVQYVGTGPTELVGDGELTLGYNDIVGSQTSNSGGFDVVIEQPDVLSLRYTGPTSAISVGGALRVSAAVRQVTDPPSGDLAEARVRITLVSTNGARSSACTAAVRPTGANAGTVTCTVRVPGPVSVGRFRAVVEVVDGPFVAPPATSTLRVIAVG